MTATRRTVLAACAAAALAAPLGAAAQQGNWPNRPVKFVVPFSAGSGTDILARMLAEKLTTKYGQGFVVENKQGADGIIGTEQIVRSTPDGYTIGVVPSSPIVMNPSLFKLPFDPQKDLLPVANIAGLGTVLGIQPNIPAKTVPEFVAHLKANPGKLNYAAGSTFTHLAGEMFKFATGTSMQAVPYKGTAPMVTAMLGNEVEVIFDPFLGAQHMKSGRIRPLAVTSAKRSSVFPDLPTLEELGYKGAVVETWIGVFAPVGTPPAIVNQLNADVKAILDMPDVKKKLADLSYDAIVETPQQMQQRIVSDTARWAKTVKDANFKVDK
ncbi:MAG TPA: tripartite tricarboxylate transporter substrate binding protein [Ramlibacter sp.]|nr:tripartite tricarboxylate transporter substrate binding protein [Ramlibacter sp.]